MILFESKYLMEDIGSLALLGSSLNVGWDMCLIVVLFSSDSNFIKR